jgi:hypothetical protein
MRKKKSVLSVNAVEAAAKAGSNQRGCKAGLKAGPLFEESSTVCWSEFHGLPRAIEGEGENLDMHVVQNARRSLRAQIMRNMLSLHLQVGREASGGNDRRKRKQSSREYETLTAIYPGSNP